MDLRWVIPYQCSLVGPQRSVEKSQKMGGGKLGRVLGPEGNDNSTTINRQQLPDVNLPN